MKKDAESLIKRYERMCSDASSMRSLWQEVGRYTLTRKLDALTQAITRSANVSDSFTPYDAAAINSVAVEAVDIHAAGCASWITPSDSPWFLFQPAREFQGKESVESWLSECTAITQTYLAASNFYTRVHELYIDRVVTGTAILTAEASPKNVLNFRVFDPGSFMIADNDEMEADTLFRERHMSARQAEERFGKDKIPAKVRNDLLEKPDNLHRFLQAVYPRTGEALKRPGNAGMPFAECWVSVGDEKKIVAESGFQELPFFANRYLRWSEHSPWGVSPAMQALAEIRGVNYLDMLAVTLAEVTVNPRIVAPHGFDGVPDLRAGGFTIGGPNGADPKEWMTSGRYDIGEVIVARKEQAVKRLFHVPLFEQFATLERQITATEVRAREAEKVARFSPAFTQLTTELLNPLLERVFMILFRAGKFPPPPQEAILIQNGEARLAFPRVVHQSRMALALQAIKESALSDMLMLFGPLAAAGSPVLDNLDEDASFRDLARGRGLPKPYLRESDARDDIRKARAEAAAAAQRAETEREMIRSNPIAEAGVEALKQQAA